MRSREELQEGPADGPQEGPTEELQGGPAGTPGQGRPGGWRSCRESQRQSKASKCASHISYSRMAPVLLPLQASTVPLPLYEPSTNARY